MIKAGALVPPLIKSDTLVTGMHRPGGAGSLGIASQAEGLYRCLDNSQF